MVLMIDNYDSFTYNLVQYLSELKVKVRVFRNDRISLEEIQKMKPDRIVISPGPGRPENAGISCQVIRTFGQEIPILGVCLGHQAIGYVFGGRIVPARRLMHGKTSLIHHRGTQLYQNLTNPFTATRYHSLVVEKSSLPECLQIEAWSEDGEIMGLKHRNQPVFGVQFHPESILTSEGKKLLANFLKI
ncbi:MAG TPA: aminodeoxychorismate/anthranilate synthase component II [bacterium]|nr:aminodeoxychorismate/anthranilate synthase component II [bacterium]HOL66029.1 aminodeoxychorismate/anthranilate synthase component II [bacterium]